MPVDLVAVDRGPLTGSVSDEGETRGRDMYVVSAPVPGRMRRIELEVGDPVVANSVLLGALLGTKIVPVPLERIRRTLADHVPGKLLAANLEALDIGYGIAVQDEYSIQFA